MQPFVVHAHFAQPQRADPWTDELDPEPSAAPDANWNERMLRTSYRPNAAGRIYDEQRRVKRIVNNFERLSFDMGRATLHWISAHHPRTYARILDGDWRSSVRTGHGTAIASTYDEVLLPLLNRRDRRTQLRWGIADFRHRFQRDPEGFWLPEMACTPDVLDDLIDAGIRFTLLAPSQIERVRHDGDDWQSPPERLDTSRVYRHLHGDRSGRFLTIALSDDELAQKIAFDPATADASVMLDRIDNADAQGGFVCAALSGETFGYHHPLADLGLAYALFEGAELRGLEPTNVPAWIEHHPASDDVTVIAGEGSAWGCTHGLGRWLRDCGCADNPIDGYQQHWRAPLRGALDTVRAAAATAFLDRAITLLRNPWRARDDYVQVRLGTVAPNDFLELHGKRSLSDDDKINLFQLLESQRMSLMLDTPAAYGAADLDTPATVAVLRYAARTLDLLGALGLPAPTDDVLGMLAEARGNVEGAGTAADMWRAHVEPARVTPRRVAAHIALRALVQAPPPAAETAGFAVTTVDSRADTRERVGLSVVRVAANELATGRRTELVAAALHLGGLDFYGMVNELTDPVRYTRAVQRVWTEFPTANVVALVKLVGEEFGGEEFGLDAALPDGRQDIVRTVFADLADRFGDVYTRLYADHQRVLEALTASGYELPRNLRAAAELTLSDRVERQLEAAASLGGNVGTFSAIRDTLGHAREQGYQLEMAAVRAALTRATTNAAAAAAASLDSSDVQVLARYLELTRELEVDVDLAQAQEHAYSAAVKARQGRLSSDEVDAVAALGALLSLAPSAWSVSGLGGS